MARKFFVQWPTRKITLWTAAIISPFLFCALAFADTGLLGRGKQYSEAASLSPIRLSRKNELRFWRLGWWVSGRIVTEKALSFYGRYDKKTGQFLSFEKKVVPAPKDFLADLETLSTLDGAEITCDSQTNDWPIYVVEGNWQGKHFTLLADIDMCASEELDILKKYSGYHEMMEKLEKK